MRDKLIELIKEARDIGDRHCEEMGSCAKCHELGYDIGKCGEIIIADHLIASGVTLQQWIPVSERLPEKTGWYRVCHKSKLISDRYFYSDSPEAFARFGSDPVTHWKPIEEPPKEGE